MKVLIASDFFTPTINGVVTSILNLQHELEKHGHEVKILTLRQTDEYGYEECVYVLPSFSAGKFYPGARVLKSFGKQQVDEIRAWNPDIIHTNNEFSTFLLSQIISSKLNIPIVHTLHTVYEDYTHYFSPSVTMGRTLAKQYLTRILSKVDAVIVPTEKGRHILEGYEVTLPIYTVPSGINLERFQNINHLEARRNLRQRYGIDENEIILLSLGRLAKEKNVEEVIRSLKDMKEGIRLMVVGGGPYKEKLQEYVEQEGLSHKVIFTGMVTPREVPLYYHMADIFVSASTSETQGLTYIEAMASGMPLVCRRDEVLDKVILDGTNGWQFDTVEGLIEAVEKLVGDRDLRERMSAESRKISGNFSTEAFYEGIMNVYESTLRQAALKSEPAPSWFRIQMMQYTGDHQEGREFRLHRRRK